MNIYELLYFVFLLSGIHSHCFSFDQYQNDTGVILDLLGKKDSNKLLINTVVDCMGKTFNTSGKSTDFLRCVNDSLHTDSLTNTDDIRYIMGNYAVRSAQLLAKCYTEKSDIIYCLRAFGDCLPLLMRNLYGFSDHTRKCRRLINLPKYDKDKSLLKDEDDSDLYESYDTYDYDEESDSEAESLYDYDDEDEFGDYDTYDNTYGDDEGDDFDNFMSEKKANPPEGEGESGPAPEESLKQPQVYQAGPDEVDSDDQSSILVIEDQDIESDNSGFDQTLQTEAQNE